MSWFRKAVFPSFIKEYNHLDFKVWNLQSLEASEFVIIDAETTGLGKKDQIITIGAMVMQGYEIDLRILLDQTYSHEKGTDAAEIHGELPQVSKKEKKVLIEELLDFVGNRVIVGHHISFDVSKVNQLISSVYKGFKLKNQVIDTANLLYRFNRDGYDNQVGGKSNLQLDIACQDYGIPIENRHTALGDAYMTAQLLMHLLSIATEKRISTLSELF